MGFKAKKPHSERSGGLAAERSLFCSPIPVITPQAVFTRERMEKGDNEGKRNQLWDFGM